MLLAKRGARVIILCRNMEKAAEAVKDIKSEAGSDLVEAQELDLASMDSIRKRASHLLENEEKIDILINNAGIAECSLNVTDIDGTNFRCYDVPPIQDDRRV